MNKPQSDASSRTVKAVSVADYIVDHLRKKGSNTVLALPAIMCFRSATRLTERKVKWIGCANELNASYDADIDRAIEAFARLPNICRTVD